MMWCFNVILFQITRLPLPDKNIEHFLLVILF